MTFQISPSSHFPCWEYNSVIAAAREGHLGLSVHPDRRSCSKARALQDSKPSSNPSASPAELDEPLDNLGQWKVSLLMAGLGTKLSLRFFPTPKILGFHELSFFQDGAGVVASNLEGHQTCPSS